MDRKKAQILLYEALVLGIPIGFVPELVVNGLKDFLSQCPFFGIPGAPNGICVSIEFTGAIQLFCGALIFVLAGWLAVSLSQQFNEGA